MKVLVFGATGTQGGATARQLLDRGVAVRALTRKPTGKRAQALEARGAEVVQGDMKRKDSIERAVEGVDALFLMGNVWEPGNDEVAQGKLVADVAAAAGVKHIVYTSVANADDHPGLKHFSCKLEVENHLKAGKTAWTILRPVYFMDNFAHEQFGPLHWSILSDVLADRTRLQMIAAVDIGHFAAAALLDPSTHTGRTIDLAGDDVNYAEAHLAYKHVFGRSPKHSRIMHKAFLMMMAEARHMFEWYREPRFHADIDALRAEHPGLLTIEGYFRTLSA